MTYHDLLLHPNFFQMLTIFDRNIADAVHLRERCQSCDGKLDRADFYRSGYGMPSGAGDEASAASAFAAGTAGVGGPPILCVSSRARRIQA